MLFFLILSLEAIAEYIESENCWIYLPNKFFEEEHALARESLRAKNYSLAESYHVLMDTLRLSTVGNRIFIYYHLAGCKECNGCTGLLIWEGPFLNIPPCRVIGTQSYGHIPSVKTEELTGNKQELLKQKN